MRDRLDASYRTSRVIHAAMVLSLFAYALVVHILSRIMEWQGVGPPDLLVALRWGLYLLGTLALGAALGLRGRLLSVEAAAFLARRAGAEAALRSLQSRLVLLLAVAEAPALFGFVLFLLGAGLRDFYLLWAASLLAQLALGPRREAWEAAARPGAPG
jgi:F0F1-type ATP synthase membrane subunit c/vacuolar-type H+-ATPase subunit K